MGQLGEEDSVREVSEREVVEAARRRDEQIARIASLMVDALEVQNVVIGLFEGDREVVLYDHGDELGAAPDEASFCREAVRDDAIREWADLSEDPKFESHELVAGNPGYRSAAAVPLSFGPRGAAGAVCVMGREPREWAVGRLELLERFASTINESIELRIARRRLDRTNRRMEAVFEAAPIGIVVLDGDGRVMRWNRCAQSIFGSRLEDLPSGRLPVVEGDDRASFEREFERVVDEGGTEEVEVHVSTGEDEERICEISLARSLYTSQDGGEIIAAVNDATERRRREAQLRKNDHRFRRIFEEAGVGMALVAPDRTILEANRALADMLDYDVASLEGMKFDELTHPDDLADDIEQFDELSESDRTSYQIEKRYIRADGSVMWGQLTVSKIEDSEGETDYMVGMIEDVTGRKQAERELTFRARHDALTDLLNREAFEESLRRVIEDSDDENWAVLFVDLDDFKQVNDTLGHTAGDEVLEVVASRFSRVVREEDVVARIGGDEFGVLLRSIEGRDQMDEVVGRFHDALAEPIAVEEETFEIAASTGIAMGRGDFEDPDEVLRAADSAMYRAKREARGSWVYWEGETGGS